MDKSLVQSIRGITLELSCSYKFGIKRLDEIFADDLVDGDFIEVAGRASTGKTLLVAHLVAYHCVYSDANAVMFSSGKPCLTVLERLVRVYVQQALGSVLHPLPDRIVPAALPAGVPAFSWCSSVVESMPLSVLVDTTVAKILDRVLCIPVFDAYTLLSTITRLQHGEKALLVSETAAAPEEPYAMDGELPPSVLPPGYHLDPGCKYIFTVDSFAAFISPILGHVKNMAGHALMLEIGRRLRQLAKQFKGFVVATNTVLTEKADSAELGKPALGQTWPSIPSVRLLLGEDSVQFLITRNVTQSPKVWRFSVKDALCG